MKKRTLLISVLFLTLFLSLLVIIHLANSQLDNDTSGEMVLSHCLYEKKSPVCDDWTYGTEFRISNQIIFAGLFFIFSDWTIVRIIGTLIIELMLLFSFCFMMHSVHVKTDCILFGAILLLLPYCVAYGRIVLYYSFYAPYIIFMFLIFACYFKALNGSRKWLLMTYIISFIACSNGIRQFFTTIVPLTALQLIICLKSRKIKKIYKVLPALLGGISGLLFFQFFILKIVHLEQGASINIKYKGFSEIIIIIFSIMRQFGYRSGIPKTSFLGIASTAGIFVMLYAVFCSVYKLITDKSDVYTIICGMLPVALLLNAITFLFFDLPYNQSYDYARYLTPASVWCIPLFTLIPDNNDTKKNLYAFSAAILIFITNGILNYCFFQNPDTFPQVYDGLPFLETDDIGKYKNSLDHLRKDNYQFGYTFSDANVLTEKLNGLPVIPLVEEEGQIIYLDLLTRKSFRDLEHDNVFLIAKYNEANTFLSYPISKNAELVHNEHNEMFIFKLSDPAEFKSYLDNLYQKK